MIRLHQEELRSMYPDMSAEFAARMDALLHALPAAKEEKQVKRISRTMILAAALLLAALSTTAYALTRPAVLDWLLTTRNPASIELESSAQDVFAKASADGITARITSLVYDGSQIAFSYELENGAPTQPVVVMLDSTITLNGLAVTIPHYQHDRHGQLVPSADLDMVPVQRNPIRRGSWCSGLPEGLSGRVEGEVTFVIYRPEKAFAYLVAPGSMWLDETIQDPDIADVRKTLESFTNTIIAESDDPDAWAAQGYTVLASFHAYEAADARSHLVEVARIRVPFAFDADKAIAYDFSGAAAQLADCTAQAIDFRLTPLTTHVHVHLTPDDNSEAAARALADKYGAFSLTDDAGAPVTYSEMDAMFGVGPRVTQEDGQWVCCHWEEMPGLQTFPANVGFTLENAEPFRFDLPTK